MLRSLVGSEMCIRDSTLTAPSDATVECDAIVYPATPIATDDCTNAVIVERDSTIISNPCPGNLIIRYTWTATDDCGNSTIDSTDLTIQDNTEPILTAPSDTTINCNTSTSTITLGIASAADNCDNSPTVTFSDVMMPDGCNGCLLYTSPSPRDS